MKWPGSKWQIFFHDRSWKNIPKFCIILLLITVALQMQNRKSEVHVNQFVTLSAFHIIQIPLCNSPVKVVFLYRQVLTVLLRWWCLTCDAIYLPKQCRQDFLLDKDSAHNIFPVQGTGSSFSYPHVDRSFTQKWEDQLLLQYANCILILAGPSSCVQVLYWGLGEETGWTGGEE